MSVFWILKISFYYALEVFKLDRSSCELTFYMILKHVNSSKIGACISVRDLVLLVPEIFTNIYQVQNNQAHLWSMVLTT